MFNAYLISTLKFQFEKIDKFNNITSAMFNAYLISTLKFHKIDKLQSRKSQAGTQVRISNLEFSL